MIREIETRDFPEANRFLSVDSARSYFMRLGLMKPDTFQGVYGEYSREGELRGLLCHRRSGTLQLYAHEGSDPQGWLELMKTLPWQQLISPAQCCGGLIEAHGFGRVEARAYLASQATFPKEYHGTEVQAMELEDLPEVDRLYDRVFDHHMPLEQMGEKLRTRRGRGGVIRRDGRIVSVAQTEFEEPHSALIVGVATLPEYRHQGLAEACVVSLCRQLHRESRIPWLQYDNPDAGKLYEKLGFQVQDRVMHCWPE